jgi:hypothetical protein
LAHDPVKFVKIYILYNDKKSDSKMIVCSF